MSATSSARWMMSSTRRKPSARAITRIGEHAMVASSSPSTMSEIARSGGGALSSGVSVPSRYSRGGAGRSARRISVVIASAG